MSKLNRVATKDINRKCIVQYMPVNNKRITFASEDLGNLCVRRLWGAFIVKTRQDSAAFPRDLCNFGSITYRSCVGGVHPDTMELGVLFSRYVSRVLYVAFPMLLLWPRLCLLPYSSVQVKWTPRSRRYNCEPTRTDWGGSSSYCSEMKGVLGPEMP